MGIVVGARMTMTGAEAPVATKMTTGRTGITAAVAKKSEETGERAARDDTMTRGLLVSMGTTEGHALHRHAISMTEKTTIDETNALATAASTTIAVHMTATGMAIREAIAEKTRIVIVLRIVATRSVAGPLRHDITKIAARHLQLGNALLHVDLPL